MDALEQMDSSSLRRKSPTVEEYCEKWLLMQSVHIRTTTLIDYNSKVWRHIIKELGNKRMAEVTIVNPQDGSRGDPYYVLYDFRSYVGAQKRIDRDYRDRLGWARKCLMNLSMSGYFSSDRTVEEYAREIWKISPYFPLSEF